MTNDTMGIKTSLAPSEKITNILKGNPQVLRSNVLGFLYSDTEDASNRQIEIQINPSYTMIDLLFSTKEDKVLINLDRDMVVKFDYEDDATIELLMSKWAVPLVGGKRSMYTFNESSWQEDFHQLPVSFLTSYTKVLNSLRDNLDSLSGTDKYTSYMQLVSKVVNELVSDKDKQEALSILLSMGRRYNEKTIFWFNALKQVSSVILKDETFLDILRIS